MKKSNFHIKLVLILGVIVSLFQGTITNAWAKVSLKKIELKVAGAKVDIYTEIKHAFNNELMEALKTGLPIEFYFKIELIRSNWLWWLGFHEGVNKTKILKTVSYDTLNKQYKYTNNDGKSEKSRVTESLEECKAWMRTLRCSISIPGDISQLKGYYYIRVRAESRFSAPGIFKTRWKRSKKFFVDPE